MNFKFRIGDLVKVKDSGDLALVTGILPQSQGYAAWQRAADIVMYTILIGGIPTTLWGYEMTKISENNAL